MNFFLLVSSISISVALIGVTINAICTTPYVKVAHLCDENEEAKYERKERLGKFANYMIVFGTLGQLISLAIYFLQKNKP